MIEPSPQERFRDLCRRDRRYWPEAYQFVFRALDYTLRKMGIHRHITGQELLVGIRELAIDDFGLMAKAVFNTWGIHRTEDFGEIVFNLVDAGLMGKTEQDSKDDFAGGYDFAEAFEHGVRLDVKIQVPPAKRKRG